MMRIRPILFVLPLRPQHSQIDHICLRRASTEATSTPTREVRTRQYKKWTPQEDDLIIRMYEQRRTLKEIATELGIPKVHALKSHVFRLRQLRSITPSSPPPREFSPEDDEFIISKSLEGWTARRIAEELNRSKPVVLSRRLKLASKYPQRLAPILPRTRHRTWTDAEEKLVVKLHREGRSSAEISDALGIAKLSVVESTISRLRREGVFLERSTAQSKISPAQVDQMKRLRQDGLSYEKIAASLGRAPSSVYRYTRARLPTGFNRDRVPWTREEIERLLQLHASGLPFRDIAPQLQRSQAACSSKHRYVVREQAFNARIGTGSQHAAVRDLPVATALGSAAEEAAEEEVTEAKTSKPAQLARSGGKGAFAAASG